MYVVHFGEVNNVIIQEADNELSTEVYFDIRKTIFQPNLCGSHNN